ncbi:MAG: NAD-dependent epimerase/dehydratase family protein [Frankiales bacterium]|nr:NAD-dependent epimerase/dehydratase family protein [Frankiales bacterium]
MDVLVLGGTSFVGRWIVQDLLDRGHTPTLFSRGKTGTDLFPGTARATGDRDAGDYESIAGASWDAVVDVSGYVPRHVQEAAAAVTTGRYLFISTGSVYDPAAGTDGMNEDSPRLPPYRDSEVVDGDTYGPLKVACEDDLRSLHGDRATIVRPGIVAGPYDPTERFTYWTRARGTVEVPGRLDQPVQVVDARDLARLVVLLLETDKPGTFNAVGPQPAVTLGELVTVCGADEVIQVAERPGFPLVLPDPSWDVMFRRSSAAALAIGMPATPLATTAADTRTWDIARGEPEIPLP